MNERIITDSNGRKHITTEPLLHPPKRPWVGLTDDEIIEWVESGEYNVITNDWASHIDFARAIESKLEERNT